MNVHICLMQQNDIEAAAELLSIAMLNNPHHIGIFMGSGEAQRREIQATFMDLFTHRPGIVFLAKEGKTIIGVMRMNACSGSPEEAPLPDGEESDIAWRKSVWFREWSRHDPVEPHWHLGPIGVLPACRRKGIGTALMQRFCHEVDLCGARAYLETDLDENVRFYEKFGFSLVSRSLIFDVESRYMLREISA